jgi:hypothetical protein
MAPLLPSLSAACLFHRAPAESSQCRACHAGNLVGTRDRALIQPSPCVAPLTTAYSLTHSLTHSLTACTCARNNLLFTPGPASVPLSTVTYLVPRYLHGSSHDGSSTISHSHHLLPHGCMTSLLLQLFPRASSSARSANKTILPTCSSRTKHAAPDRVNHTHPIPHN